MTNQEGCEDHTYNYHRSKLAFGLILFDYHDTIKEGDGERLFDIYKVCLLLFKANKKSKYAYAVFLYLVKIVAILSKKEAHSLKWNRFFNKHGIKAGNIPLDLRMEQLNKIVKTMWRSLGANLNETSAARLANTVDEMERILNSVDNDCGIQSAVGYRTQGNQFAAVQQITKDLLSIGAFTYQEGRQGHPSFPKFPRSLLGSLNFKDLHLWMVELIKTWEPLYDLNKT